MSSKVDFQSSRPGVGFQTNLADVWFIA